MSKNINSYDSLSQNNERLKVLSEFKRKLRSAYPNFQESDAEEIVDIVYSDSNKGISKKRLIRCLEILYINDIPLTSIKRLSYSDLKELSRLNITFEIINKHEEIQLTKFNSQDDNDFY